MNGCAGLLGLLCGLMLGSDLWAREVVLFDFEEHPLSHFWSASGPLEAERVRVPPLAHHGRFKTPSGHGLRILTKGHAGIFAVDKKRIPSDWRTCRALSLWVYRAQREAAVRERSVCEIVVTEKHRRVQFWRRVDVSHTGWKRIVLPLRFFRWRTGTVPRWQSIYSLELRVRGHSDLTFDTICLEQTHDPQAAFLSQHDLTLVAFPQTAPHRVRWQRGPRADVVTDSRQIAIKQLVKHLEAVTTAVHQRLPFLPPTTRRPLLIVFEHPADYQAFTPRLAARLGGVGPPPKSSGFTLQGIATSHWNPRIGTLRPVYTHEFIHSLLSTQARIGNQGEWLHEGFASLFQRQFHPQQNLEQIVRDGLDKPTHRLPLQRLCNGTKVPANRYWQAMTVVELLMEKRYARRLPNLFAQFARNGSTDLGPYLKTELATDWQQLTEHWRVYCRQAYQDTDRRPME